MAASYIMRKPFFKHLAGTFQSLLLLALATVAYGAPPVATVQTLVGASYIKSNNATTSKPLKVRTALYPKDIIATGPNSKLTLLFRSGAQVRLNEKSALEIADIKTTANSQSLVRLLGGEIWARLRPGNKIQTKTAILGVLGTEIHLAAAEDGTSTLTVTEGSVNFSNEFGAVVVKTSQQSVARPGAAPTAPLTIENAGFILEWSLDLDRATIPRERFYVSLNREVLAAEAARRQEQLRAQPNNAISHRNYGDILFDQGQFPESLAAYREAEKLQDNSAALQNRIGDALLESGQIDEAKQVFDASLRLTNGKQDADAANSLIGLSWVALRHERPEEAARLAASAVDADKRLGPIKTIALSAEGQEAADIRAQALIAQGIAALRRPNGIKAASTSFENAAALDSRYRYQAHSWLAMAQLAENDPAAEDSARTSVKMAPDSSLAHGNLALVYLFQGQSRLAQNEARQAAALNPRSVAINLVLGQTALARGDVDEAASVAAQAVALDPSLPQARYLLGIADAGRRDYRHAEQSLTQSLRLAPDFLPAAAALARVYNNMGQSKKALTVLQELLPRHRQADAVLASLGAVSYEQGNYSESGRFYRDALKSKPNSALYQAELARTLVYGNRLNEAISYAQNAVSLAPQIGQYHSILGLAYEFSGLNVQSEREYREAILRDPQNSLALTRLAEVANRLPGVARRLAVGSDTQAFIFDPSVAQQILRGGINTEIQPQTGDEGRRGVDLSNRLVASEGRFNALSFFKNEKENGSRANADSVVTDASTFLTYTPSPRLNVYGTARGVSQRSGLQGADSAPVFDDRLKFRYGQAQVAARRRQSADSDLWFGLFGNTSQSLTSDPGLDSFIDNLTGLPVQRQDFDSSALMPEVRFNRRLRGDAGQTGLLTFGLAYAQTDFKSRRNLQFPILNAPAFQRFEQNNKTLLGYAQISQRLNDRLAFSGQLRVQNRRRDQNSLVTLPNQGPLTAATQSNRTLLLPSLLTTYRINKNTLRLSLNRQVTDQTTSTFAPVDTLIASEQGALPFGTPDTAQLAQIDFERYLGARSFAKVFVFHSTANQVTIGESDLTGLGTGLPASAAPIITLNNWRASGAGLRLEHRLSTSLFANFGFLIRQTSNSTPGTLFDGGRAPYEANNLATLSLNHIDKAGNKLGVQLRHVGSFFQDVPLEAVRPTFPSKFYVDLRLAKEPSVHNEIFVSIRNLFNQPEIGFNDFRTGRRRIDFGVARRF